MVQKNISPTRAGGEIGKNFLQAKTSDNTVITPYFAGVCVCVCVFRQWNDQPSYQQPHEYSRQEPVSAVSSAEEPLFS